MCRALRTYSFNFEFVLGSLYGDSPKEASAKWQGMLKRQCFFFTRTRQFWDVLVRKRIRLSSRVQLRTSEKPSWSSEWLPDDCMGSGGSPLSSI